MTSPKQRSSTTTMLPTRKRGTIVPRHRALFPIGIASELAGVHPQTMRSYERRGLVEPVRTAGRTRLYTVNDIARVRRIRMLTTDAGLNLEGARIVVLLEEALTMLLLRLAWVVARLRPVDASTASDLESLGRDVARGIVTLPDGDVDAALLRARAHPHGGWALPEPV